MEASNFDMVQIPKHGALKQPECSGKTGRSCSNRLFWGRRETQQRGGVAPEGAGLLDSEILPSNRSYFEETDWKVHQAIQDLMSRTLFQAASVHGVIYHIFKFYLEKRLV